MPYTPCRSHPEFECKDYVIQRNNYSLFIGKNSHGQLQINPFSKRLENWLKARLGVHIHMQ